MIDKNIDDKECLPNHYLLFTNLFFDRDRKHVNGINMNKVNQYRFFYQNTL